MNDFLVSLVEESPLLCSIVIVCITWIVIGPWLSLRHIGGIKDELKHIRKIMEDHNDHC